MTTRRSSFNNSLTFWMSEKVMYEMQRGKRWKCAILRTDRWEHASLPASISGKDNRVVSKGRRWADY